MTALATQPTANGIQPAEAPKGKAAGLVNIDNSTFSNLLDTAKFEHIWRVAQMFSQSKLVPQHFQGDAPSCFIACQMAVRLQVDPFMFMQNTYIVQGKPGMEAKLAIALVNSSGIFKGPIQWKMEGDGMKRQATAYAVHSRTNELCECMVSMEIAQAEGWMGKNGSKWKTMPDQMLKYWSATWFARLYAPECLMGMQAVDELEDTAVTPIHVENEADGRTRSERLLDRITPKPEVVSDQDTTSDNQNTNPPAKNVNSETLEAPPKLAKLNPPGEKTWEQIKGAAAEALGVEGELVIAAGLAFLKLIGLKHDDLIEGKHRAMAASKLAGWDWNTME